MAAQPLQLPQLAHVTTLDALYNILNSGYLRSRAQTGAPAGFSGTLGNPNYVYLSLDTRSNLPPGQVKLVFSPQVLSDRNDYFLNTKWGYGVVATTLPARQLATWLISNDGLGEILFPSEIPLASYLREIIVPQFSPAVVRAILAEEPATVLPILNMDKIPPAYRPLLKIV